MKTIDLAGVYFAYDRPDNIIKTLPILLNSNLKTIYIFVDGPKNKKNIIKVNKTKKNIINLTKGNKKIYRIFYKKNLGVKKNFFKSLDFVFKKEKQAIILEDDCLIKENFIDFCFHLLKKYKKNKKIWAISGSNFIEKETSAKNLDYLFSKYFFCWGWSTWSDRWLDVDQRLTFWDRWKKSHKFKTYFSNHYESDYWRFIFDQVYNGSINSWAYSVKMNLFYKNKLTIIPKVNLVENLGFGKNSTTTLDYNVHLDKKLNSNFSLNRMIKAPKIKNDNILDQKLFDLVWSGDRIKSNSLFKLLIYYIKDFKRIFLKYYYRFFNKI